MKILILLKKYEGGVGSVVRCISKELEKKGYEVKVISREDDLNIFNLKESIFPLRRLVSNLMEKEGFDVIYVQDWSMAFPLLFPRKIFFNKLFCVFYGENPKKQIGGYYLQKIVGRLMGKKIVVCNDHLKQMFKKSNLIYNRVDYNSFKPDRRIKRIKNSVGFANWPIEEYHFSEIKGAVTSLGKKLVIAENISKEKMPEFFRKLECFISLPPSYAGFGLVYLEAMASGIPKIIGSKFGGGNVLPITKIEEYKNIEEAIKNAKKENYRKWILDNKFTWEDGAGELINIFKNNLRKLKKDIIKHRGILLSMKNPKVKDRFSHFRLRIQGWEHPEAKMIKKYLPSNQDFIELGGCIGFTSCVARKYKNTRKHIIVEANPDLIETIKENIKMVNSKEVEVINRAYSTSKKNVVFKISPTGIGSSSISRADGKEIQIQSITLKEIIDTYKIDRFNLMVDIEGNETELISNEMGLLKKRCDILIIELHSEIDITGLRNKLIANGFKLLDQQEGVYVFKNG